MVSCTNPSPNSKRHRAQTHRPRYLCSNRPHLCTPCKRCGLKSAKQTQNVFIIIHHFLHCLDSLRINSIVLWLMWINRKFLNQNFLRTVHLSQIGHFLVLLWLLVELSRTSYLLCKYLFELSQHLWTQLKSRGCNCVVIIWTCPACLLDVLSGFQILQCSAETLITCGGKVYHLSIACVLWNIRQKIIKIQLRILVLQLKMSWIFFVRHKCTDLYKRIAKKNAQR